MFRKADFLNLLRARGCVRDGVGGSPYKWNVLTAANSSTEVFAEGQAPPVAGRQTNSQASVSAFYVRGTCGISGHVRDNIRKGGFYPGNDPLDIERMLLEADVLKKVDDELCGSTADRGIASCIDSTGTYAGLAQSSVAVWASEENGSIGILGLDDMQDLYEEMTSATVSSVPRDASPTDWVMPVNQITNYVNTIGAAASSGSTFTHGPGQNVDFGQTGAIGKFFNQIPIQRVRGITSTEIYLLDLTGWELLIHRDLELAPIVGNVEMDQLQLSVAFALKIRERNKHGKMTGVTA